MNYELGSILNTETSSGSHEKDVVSRRREAAGPVCPGTPLGVIHSSLGDLSGIGAREEEDQMR